jgi:hypothetical protein
MRRTVWEEEEEEMAARLAPAGHYNAGSLAGDALHDLNTVDSRNAHVDAILDADRGVATGDDLETITTLLLLGCVNSFLALGIVKFYFFCVV